MNGQFRPSPPIQMDQNGQMIRMGGARGGPSFAPGPPIHVPPRSPITSRAHPQRILQQKPIVLPTTCIEEELHTQIQHKYVLKRRQKTRILKVFYNYRVRVVITPGNGLPISSNRTRESKICFNYSSPVKFCTHSQFDLLFSKIPTKY